MIHEDVFRDFEEDCSDYWRRASSLDGGAGVSEAVCDTADCAGGFAGDWGSLARSDTRATGWNNIRSIKTEQDYHEQNSCKTKMADAL